METIKLNRFTKGLNNVDPDTDLPEGALREALNVDMTNLGRIRRREGYTRIYSGTNIHSLWHRHFVEAGDLKFLNSDNSATTIASGLSDKPLSYCEVNGITYFSNEYENGTVQGPWGVDDIFSEPNVTVIPGQLKAGTYQIAFTTIASNGEESGATNPLIIQIQDGEGIHFDQDVTAYLSSPNGTELFKQKPGQDILSFNDEGEVIQTLFMKKMIPGHLIRHYKGRIYAANGSTLWYTEAQRYGLYKPSENFFDFPSRITVMQETESGLFVVADKVYFLTGNDPATMQLNIVGKSTAVEGTGITSDAKNFKLEFNGKVAYWFGSKGAVLGFPNGQLKYLSEDRFALNMESNLGTTGYQEHDGIQKMVTNLFEQSSDGSAFGASDNVVAQVIRNGVVIQ